MLVSPTDHVYVPRVQTLKANPIHTNCPVRSFKSCRLWKGENIIRVLLLALVVVMALATAVVSVSDSLPQSIVKCKFGNADCTITNIYDLVAVFSAAAVKKQHMRLLSCLGGPASTGPVSTQKLNRVVAVDAKARQMTFKVGITMRWLITVAEELVLPYSSSLTGGHLGGLLAIGSHDIRGIAWYPGQEKVVYRDDVRLPVTAPGKGKNDFNGFQPQLSVLISTLRKSGQTQMKILQFFEVADPSRFWASLQRNCWKRWENSDGRCLLAKIQMNTSLATGESSLTDFTEYPVVGNQSEMQSSGSCLTGETTTSSRPASGTPHRRALLPPDGVQHLHAGRRGLVADVKKLHAQRPGSLCGLDLYSGLLMRFVRNSTDPRLDQDIIEEVEQMAFFKYGAVPHWGKNRHVGFIGAGDKYGDRRDRFVAAMVKYDGEGLFSSDWTDAVLGIRGKSLSVEKKGCALEGLCICSRDEHCAPAKGYFCRQGLVYEDARVCRKSGDGDAPIVHIEL
ncbi:unnamed protein product [Spirodela intermedia]|uniref:L-gulonolactone oxidase 2-like C-terminal domain-containing protein n=1 Tax=Spirodela intermedia TaxID=51605 RepID=A0A7I8IYG6_SPIIN|nr:unnamed protein product [Spirodela intermedia]CAA6663035.1 unnamed protein product [Spirodela intermedia]